MSSDVEYLFCAYCPSLRFLWKNAYLCLLLIFQSGLLCFVFFLKLSFMSCLYILNSNQLSSIPFANIFSHSVDYLLILQMVSYTVHKLLNLIMSHLFICASVSFSLEELMQALRKTVWGFLKRTKNRIPHHKIQQFHSCIYRNKSKILMLKRYMDSNVHL